MFETECDAEAEDVTNLFQRVSRLRSLTQLTIAGVGSESLHELTPLANLTSLDVSRLSNILIPRFGYVDSFEWHDAAHAFSRLQHLNISSKASDEWVDALTELRSLKSLQVDVQKGSDLSAIAQMTNLTALHAVLVNKRAGLVGDELSGPLRLVKLELTGFQNSNALEGLIIS